MLEIIALIPLAEANDLEISDFCYGSAVEPAEFSIYDAEELWGAEVIDLCPVSEADEVISYADLPFTF